MEIVNQTRARKMSLVCTPQTGKVLNYNSSVNRQLIHRRINWQSTRQATKLPKGN